MSNYSQIEHSDAVFSSQALNVEDENLTDTHVVN